MTVNYAQEAVDAIRVEYPDLEPDLTMLYALLVLVLGPFTSLEDVHDAWSLWRNSTFAEHRSIVPFDELELDVQELDRPYMDAIHRAAERISPGCAE